MKYFCDLRGWVENPKWVLTKYNYWWNWTIWIYDKRGEPYGKSYRFIPYFIVKFLKKYLI